MASASPSCWLISTVSCPFRCARTAFAESQPLRWVSASTLMTKKTSLSAGRAEVEESGQEVRWHWQAVLKELPSTQEVGLYLASSPTRTVRQIPTVGVVITTIVTRVEEEVAPVVPTLSAPAAMASTTATRTPSRSMLAAIWLWSAILPSVCVSPSIPLIRRRFPR